MKPLWSRDLFEYQLELITALRVRLSSIRPWSFGSQPSTVSCKRDTDRQGLESNSWTQLGKDYVSSRCTLNQTWSPIRPQTHRCDVSNLSQLLTRPRPKNTSMIEKSMVPMLCPEKALLLLLHIVWKPATCTRSMFRRRRKEVTTKEINPTFSRAQLYTFTRIPVRVSSSFNQTLVWYLHSARFLKCQRRRNFSSLRVLPQSSYTWGPNLTT